jgi:hypothetical protein
LRLRYDWRCKRFSGFPNAHTDSNGHLNRHSYTYGNGYSNCHRYAHRNGYRDSHRNGYCDRNADARPHWQI